MIGIVTAKAEHLVERFAIFVGNVDGGGESLGELLSDLCALGSAAPGAFARKLKADDPQLRMLGAWGVLVSASDYELPAEWIAESECIFENVLGSNTEDHLVIACHLLRIGGARPRMTARLRNLIAHPNGRVGVMAAAALCQIEEGRRYATQILLEAMRHEDEFVAGVASSALLGIGWEHGEAIDVIADRIGRGEDGVLKLVLGSLRRGTTKSVKLFETLRRLAADESVSLDNRCLCVRALGCVGSNAGHVETALRAAMESSHSQIVRGAIEGSDAHGRFPERASELLAAHLQSADHLMRGVASQGLLYMGRLAAPVLPLMIRAFERESNVAVLAVLGPAIARSGVDGTHALIDVICQCDIRTADVAVGSLRAAGRPAAAAIAARLGDRSMPYVARHLLLLTVATMGESAGPAVQDIGEHLNICEHDEDAKSMAMALRSLGRTAVPAAGHLVRCILDEGRSESTHEWACRALAEAGPEVNPIVDAELGGASPAQRLQFESLMHRYGSLVPERFARFVELNDDTEVEKFVQIGTALRTLGPTSQGDLADYFGDKPDVPKHLALQKSSIQRVLKEMKRVLDCELVQPDSRGAGGLTDKGRHWLTVAEEYLEMKHLRKAKG